MIIALLAVLALQSVYHTPMEKSQFFRITPEAPVEPYGQQHGLGLRQAVNAIPAFGGHVPLRKPRTQASQSGAAVLRSYIHIFQQQRADFIMAPNADKANTGAFLPSAGADLYKLVDEDMPVAADFVARGGAPTAQTYQLELANPSGSIGVGAGSLHIAYAIRGTSGAWTIAHRLKEGGTTHHTHTITGTVDGEAEAVDAILAATVVNIAAGNPDNLFLEVEATVPGAAQVLRPQEDNVDLRGGWAPSSGSSLSAMIDESSPSTADYIQSKAMRPGDTDTCEVLLTPGENPWVTAGRSVAFTYQATEAGCSLKVELVNDETVVESVTLTSLSTSWTAHSWTLTQPLTEYGDLRLRFTASYPATVTPTALQKLRPSATGTNFQWSVSGAASHHAAISETSPSDSEIIFTPPAGVEFYDIVFDLPSAEDPLTLTNHVLKVRTFWNGAFGSKDITYQVRDQTTVVATGNVACPSGAFATQTIPLTLPTIGLGYASLKLYFLSNDDGIQISWAELQIPAPRRVRIAHAQLNAASLARVEIQWQQVRLPRAVAAYQGDVPSRYAGTTTALFEIDDGSWVDRKAYAYGATAPQPAGWDFCSAGPHVIATNWTDPVQWRQDGTAAAFADLITSTEKPRGRFCCMARQFLLLGDIRNPGSAGGYAGGSDFVWWSDPANIRNFQPVLGLPWPNFAQVLSIPGQIMGLVSSPDGAYIFKRRGIVKLEWAGGNLVWQQVPVSISVGTPLPGSIVVYDDEIFWWGGNCFYRMSIHGGAPRRIAEPMGAFLGDSTYSPQGFYESGPETLLGELSLMQGAVDYTTGTLWWAYRSRGEAEYRYNRILIYNPREDRWGYCYGGTAASFGGIVLSDDLQISSLCTLPATIGANNLLFRGVEGVRDQQSDPLNKTAENRWFSFTGSAIYPVTYETQAFTLEELAADGVDFEVLGVTPIFSIEPPSGSWPSLVVTVTTARDQSFVLGASSQTATRSNEYGRYPFYLSGSFVKVKIQLEGLAAGTQNYGLKGFYLHYQPGGRRA
jgi:hypothetical protein